MTSRLNPSNAPLDRAAWFVFGAAFACLAISALATADLRDRFLAPGAASIHQIVSPMHDLRAGVTQ